MTEMQFAIEFAEIAHAVARKYPVALTTLEPFTAAAVARFYWAVVVAVCGGVLFITWRRSATRSAP